jgi:glycosyltransferase involved in cell wall biosynthesis
MLPIDVIIPALDEQSTIGGVLDEINREHVRRVIVADNGSRDDTVQVARAHGAEIATAAHRGYGHASLAALAMIAVQDSVVLWLVADGSDDPSELLTVAGPVARGEVDLCVGSRMLGTVEHGAMTAMQRHGSAFAAAVIAARFGVPTTDLGPYRAIHRVALERLDMRDTTWGWTIEMQVKAARAGLRSKEVAVSWRHRKGGQPKVAGTLRGTLGASHKIGSWMLAAVLGPALDPVR